LIIGAAEKEDARPAATSLTPRGILQFARANEFIGLENERKLAASCVIPLAMIVAVRLIFAAMPTMKIYSGATIHFSPSWTANHQTPRKHNHEKTTAIIGRLEFGGPRLHADGRRFI
jgi:hypothetical protein